MRHSTEKFIEHGTGLGIDPTGDGPIGSIEKMSINEPTGTDPIRLSSETKGGIDDGHKVIDDGNHGGMRLGEMFVAIGRSNVGKSVFNEDHNDINSQPERFYAKANGAFLSEGWMG